MLTKKSWLSGERLQQHWSQLARSRPSDWKLPRESRPRALLCYKTEGKKQPWGLVVGILMFVSFFGGVVCELFLCYKLAIENEMRRKLILLNTSGLSGTPRKDELEQEILDLGNLTLVLKVGKIWFSIFKQSSFVNWRTLWSLYIH